MLQENVRLGARKTCTDTHANVTNDIHQIFSGSTPHGFQSSSHGFHDADYLVPSSRARILTRWFPRYRYPSACLISETHSFPSSQKMLVWHPSADLIKQCLLMQLRQNHRFYCHLSLICETWNSVSLKKGCQWSRAFWSHLEVALFSARFALLLIFFLLSLSFLFR